MMGNLSRNIDNCADNITTLVGQQGRGFDVAHFGNFVVKLNEAGGVLFARNDFKRILELRADR